MAKPYHGGRAAAAGLQAAGLAAAGMTASPTALEGKHGLMRALSPQGNVDLETLPRLGDVWRSTVMRLNVKKYPTVGASQRSIDAVLALAKRVTIDPRRVQKIVARVSERHAAVMPYHTPQNALQAKFSLEFAIASAVVHQAVGFDQLLDGVVRSDPVQHLMSKVRIETTAEFEPAWRDAAPFDEITFTLDDGTELVTPQVRRATGHADTPLPPHELWAKFLSCARHTGVSEAQARDLFDAAQHIDAARDALAIRWPA